MIRRLTGLFSVEQKESNHPENTCLVKFLRLCFSSEGGLNTGHHPDELFPRVVLIATKPEPAHSRGIAVL